MLAKGFLDLYDAFHGIEGVAAGEEIVTVAMQICLTQHLAENVQDLCAADGQFLTAQHGILCGQRQTGIVHLAVGGVGQLR